MMIFDYLEIDDKKIPKLFKKSLSKIEADKMDIDILKAFYTLKYNNPQSSIFKFSDIAEFISRSNNSPIGFNFLEIEKRAERLIHLPFIWDLNDEIDYFINNSNDSEAVKMWLQYKDDGGSGLIRCHFIPGSIFSFINPDGSVLHYFQCGPDPIDHLFFKP